MAYPTADYSGAFPHTLKLVPSLHMKQLSLLPMVLLDNCQSKAIIPEFGQKQMVSKIQIKPSHLAHEELNFDLFRKDGSSISICRDIDK